MKASYASYKFLLILVFLALGAIAFSENLAAQDDAWQITRADYGWRSQRTDVTGLVSDLVSRGGVNGRLAVTNQTMGGDPAPGRDKVLRIFAVNRRGQEREFDYNEGGFVDVRTFVVRGAGDWDDRNDNRGHDDRDRDHDRDRNDWRGVQIIRGYYGVKGRTVNVTDLLRSRVRDGALVINANNNAMGGDPAPGEDKVLIVIYRFEGREQAAAVREGNTLALP
jgi:hypothetical protein